jgi:membrane protease YdiL (CAAX protease family)
MKWNWPATWIREKGGWWRLPTTLVLTAASLLVANLLVMALFSGTTQHIIKKVPTIVQEYTLPVPMMVTGGLGLAGCLLGIRLVHRKPIACVFTDGRAFRFKLVIESAVVWSLLWLVAAASFPGGCARLAQRISEIPLGWGLGLFIGITCGIATQATLEEVLFRGYLLPRVAAWVKSSWIAVFILALVFALGHSDMTNPPVGILAAAYGITLGVGAVRCGSLAPLIGMHAANNVLEMFWFPKQWGSLSYTLGVHIGWHVVIVLVVALSVWLGWLLWITHGEHEKSSPNTALEPTAAAP